MSQFNLPTVGIDLAKVNIVANERDLKLWKQQATAKYCKRAYEDFRRENEILNNKIKNLEKKIEKDEKKIPKIKALTERMVGSVIIASDVVDHLIQLKLYVKSERALLEKEYGTLIENYSNMYKQERMLLERNNMLYKVLNEITTKVEEMKIQKKKVCQNIMDQNKIIKQKDAINNQILITNIVDFVKMITNAHKFEFIKNELAEKKVQAQALLELYEKQNEIKRNIQKCSGIQRSELPKLSIQLKPMYKAVELNMPAYVKTAQSCQKLNTVAKVNEINLLKKLKERSAERLKIIWQRQNSNLMAAEVKEPEQKHVENNSTATIAIDENKIENKNVLQQEMSKPLSKINILQNEVIGNNNALINNVTESQKRASSENVKSIIKKKKTKKVSFGECLSQDDTPANINTVVTPSESVQEISSYFSKNTAKNYQQGVASSGPITENPIPSQFCFEGDESFYIPKDTIDTSNDHTFFSMTRSPENVFDQTQNNTFFSWSHPNSQQNTSFGNPFSLF